MEAFMVATDGYMYRSWQLSFDKWSTWDKTGYSAPKTTHAPVAHAMDANVFNGRLNVFVHGNDGKLHHIWQTTCDKVPNPWGWCTWSTWNEVSGDVPLNPNYPTNSLSIGNNLHLGIEVCNCQKYSCSKGHTKNGPHQMTFNLFFNENLMFTPDLKILCKKMLSDSLLCYV